PDGESAETAAADEPAEPDAEGTEDDEAAEGTSRRRRRRRRRGAADGEEPGAEDPPNTVTRVREPRKASRSRAGREDDDGVRSVKGSTRLEAKKQRRREGRDAGRRRPSIITEAEFLARRESVDRVMIVRQTGERTQIAVLEDDVLVEHYVSSASSTGLVGNVYLGKVQNVLPSMEAAFVDIGKGRNAVLYAGEVNWDAAGLDGQPRRIELALKSGDPVLVQVTKDPIGHKGARLTSQVSLAGRYLVLVPGGSMTGISRKLPDTERSRLKAILKKVVPEGAGVIVRTAAEGASEEELSRDVARLTAQWEDIDKKAAKGSSAPALLYGEPDMTIRVVRDIFNEDFASLVVAGDDAWDMLEPYVAHVAPDLRDRMTRWTDEKDVFAAHRVDEQLAKALDRKVWLPSGGYLVIDRTEAMVVVDVNTGKFTGQGGNLEETVTKNNLEAAEEIVRQLRLRDLGGIIVIDFIDMVLESNRELVLRRMLECLGRDRTKHQVAEVTSLGLVQMTRKRVGQGLHEVFSETCEECNGRGYHIRGEPVDSRGGGNGDRKGGARAGGKGARGASSQTKGRGRTSGKAGEPDSDEAADSPDADSPAAVAAAGVAAAGVAAADVVAVEDPVEPATAASVSPDGPEPAPKPARRRRRAVSPVTTL
ncbi:MAG: Rne/Rng family ribonuclease, partial [Actinomycetes bacterium]